MPKLLWFQVRMFLVVLALSAISILLLLSGNVALGLGTMCCTFASPFISAVVLGMTDV